MSEDKKRDRAFQRRVRERQAKTGESYQAAWQQLADQKDPEDSEQLFARSSTGLPSLDDVLGGGLVSGSVVLFAGPVGSGRTSLTLQMLKGLGHRCLYATSEDTREQAAANAQRIKAGSDQISQLAERDVAKILAYAQKVRAQTIANDTIQRIFCADIEGKAGSAKQLVECVNRLVDYAKANDTAIWLVGHVTSDGTIAGPTAIEHSVDVVLTIERGACFEGRERIVSCTGKNRFGPSNLARCFELTAEGFVPVDDARVLADQMDHEFQSPMAAEKANRNSPSSRLPLPLSTNVKVLPGQSAQITARPQISASFWPDRLLIKNADRWDVRRLSIGLGKSPWSSLIEDEHHRRRASVFSLDTWHPLISREVSLGEPIIMEVTYTGPNELGENFEAVLFGWDSEPPAKPSIHNKPADNSKRISERAESKTVRANEMVILPITITSPALLVDRFTIADAENWIVHDIRTHGKSIFVQNGDLPGEMFTGSVPVILKPLAADDRVEIAATYVGKNTSACLMVELSGPAKPTNTPRAASYFLPVSADVPIFPTQCAQIMGQTGKDFWPDRVVIADPDAWLINDIKIGNRCVIAQSGDVPGQAFSIHAVGCDVTFSKVSAAYTFEIVTTRAADCKESAGFYGGVQGRLVQER